MNRIEQFEQLLNKLYNLPPKPTEYCYYITKKWVPFAKEGIEKGWLPCNTKIIIIPNVIQENYIKELFNEDNTGNRK